MGSLNESEGSLKPKWHNIGLPNIKNVYGLSTLRFGVIYHTWRDRDLCVLRGHALA